MPKIIGKVLGLVLTAAIAVFACKAFGYDENDKIMYTIIFMATGAYVFLWTLSFSNRKKREKQQKEYYACQGQSSQKSKKETKTSKPDVKRLKSK